MTGSGIQIIFKCGNCCKHLSGVTHDPRLISCSVAEMKAWQKDNNRELVREVCHYE
jgi:hypothetical protein